MDKDSDEIEVYTMVFDEGDAESWIQWQIQLDDLIWDKQLTDGRQKTVLAEALLKGSAQETFWCDIILGIDINQDDADINEEDFFKETFLQQAEERQSQILEADYSKVDMKSYIHSLYYLNSKEKDELLSTVQQFPNLFSGGLGTLQIKPIRLELKNGFKPYHAKPHGIPQAYLQTTKKEVERLKKLGIWKQVNSSPWTAATFIQPKKTGDIRVLTDFHK